MIRLGYEIGTGSAVEIPLRHTAVTGQTQESGKTTTLEAIITRSELRAVAFLTKRGEASFRLQTPIAPYFREPELAPETPMWRWVESIFETMGETVGKEEKAAIIQASDEILERESYKSKGETKKRLVSTGRKVRLLEDVAENVILMLAGARGKAATALTCLNAYFKIVLPQIEAMKASRKLDLAQGLNVMNLEALTSDMQMLVIRSVVETVYLERRHTVVIIPEAAKFIPRMRNSPVRFAAEMFIRQGLGIGNVLMLDSQDLANVATETLKSVGVWILGKQSEINEVKRVVDYIPSNPKIPREAIMQLGKGQFYAVFSGTVKKVYVQPAGMAEEHARAIARGEETADSWKQIVRRLDRDGPKQVQILEQSEADAEPSGRDGLQGAMVESSGDSGGHSDGREETIGAAVDGEATRAAVRDGDRSEANRSREGQEAQDQDGSEETMWKERFEKLQRAIEAASFVLREDGKIENITPFKRPESRDSDPRLSSGNGSFAELKRRLREDPEVLELLAQRPRIEITIERATLPMDTSKTPGRVALLIKEGFFREPKPMPEVRAEFLRRAWAGKKTSVMVIEAQVIRLAEMGFLTVEPAGYLQAPDAEIVTKKGSV